MFQRLWNFAKRHKKKLIGTGVLFGGGYVAWKVLMPKLQDYMMQRLLKSMGQGDLLKDLLGEMGQPAEDPEELDSKKRAKFNHNQEVSDNHTQKGLESLSQRLMSCFKVDECTQALAKAANKEEKLKCIEDLQVECLARSMSTLYALHLLLLLHRVEFNIVGREVLGSDSKLPGSGAASEDTDVLTAFVVSVSYAGGEGLSHICEAIRGAVKSCWAAESMKVTTKVNEESLHSFLLAVCNAANASLLEGGNGPATLLPESLDTSVAPKVKQLLDETRDYIESPQFLNVFRSIVASALKKFVDSLGEVLEVTEPARAPPLSPGASVPIAKLGGDCVKRSQAMLASGDDAGFVGRFADDPLVAKLCEALYFVEAKNQ